MDRKRRKDMLSWEREKQRHASGTFLFCLFMASFFAYGAYTATKGGWIMLAASMIFALCAVEDICEIRVRKKYIRNMRDK